MAKEVVKSIEWSKTIERLDKDYGKGSVMKFGDKATGDYETLSTGSLSFNAATGINGFARGKMYELMGWEGTGKTTICGHLAADAQAKYPDKKVVYIDAEHALDMKYLEKLGVNTKEMFISQPSNGEEGFNIASELVKTGDVSLLILDSDTSMKPKSEVEGEIGDSSIGKKARLNNQAVPILHNLCAKNKTCVVVISQFREKIGVMFGSPVTTSGGHALKFYSDVRVEISKTLQKEGDGSIMGSEVKVKITKNKMAPPFKAASFHIEFGVGINRIKEVFDYCVEFNIIEKSGSWFSYEGSNIGQGETAVLKLLNDNPAMVTDLENKVKEKLNERD